MLAVKRFDPEGTTDRHKKPSKGKPSSSPSSSSSSSSFSSDSDSDGPPPRQVASTPAKAQQKKAAAPAPASSDSDSSSSSSSSSDSDDAGPRKRAKSSPGPSAPSAPVSSAPPSFSIPSGVVLSREEADRQDRERRAALVAEFAAKEAAAKAAKSAAQSTAPPAVAPKLKQLTAKQAATLTRVAKLNAAQAAKLDANELEAYRRARAEEKKALRAARSESLTPEERAAAKAQAKAEKRAQAKAHAAGQIAAKAAAAQVAPEVVAPKAPKPPKVVVPVVPSASAATNPALRSEGLKKKDESVRAQERAERKRARRVAMGLPAEEEAAEQKESAESADVAGANVPMDTTESAPEDAATTSHKRKLDEMRSARMAAVEQRDAVDPLQNAMGRPARAGPLKDALSPTTQVVITPSAAPAPSEIAAAQHAKPLWMLRGRQISSMSSVAVEDFALDSRIKGVLKKMGIDRFFAAQSELLPVILKAYGTNDICCCAPTGSGKTLTYLLPLCQALSTRILTRLRALILLPSRDLALQVLKVLQPFAQALGLKVECILGQSSFAAEQARLITRDDAGVAGSSVDILICTPGRLMDHLSAADESNGAYPFHLRDLQYLVIDEIDRLLTQNYSDWPSKILSHVFAEEVATGVGAPTDGLAIGLDDDEKMDDGDRADSSAVDSVVLTQRSVRRRFAAGGLSSSGSSAAQHLPLQKLLFSATLTNNPQKLASLQLHNPLFFTEATSERKKYSIPAGLKQWVINLPDAAQKPVHLVALLDHLRKQKVKKAALAARAGVTEGDDAANEQQSTSANQILIFTSSVESTHRLYRLLECYDGGRAFPGVSEFSSALTQVSRSRILKKFARGDCTILICSDAMARGMDLANVDVVINYDVPTYVQTYVHRIGRTARAGGTGTAYTMVKSAQFRSFKGLLHGADNSFYSVHPVLTEADMQPMMPAYQQGLAALKTVLQTEKQGDQNPHQPINVSRTPTIERARSGDSLRAHLASAAAVALESAAEVDDAVDADLEDAKQATATATDQRTPAGAAPSETPIDTTPAPTMAKPKSKKEAYNLVQQLLNAGPGAAPNRKVLL